MDSISPLSLDLACFKVTLAVSSVGKSSGPSISPKVMFMVLQMRFPIIAMGLHGFPTTRCHSPVGRPVKTAAGKTNSLVNFSVKAYNIRLFSWLEFPRSAAKSFRVLFCIWVTKLDQRSLAFATELIVPATDSATGSPLVVWFGSTANLIKVFTNWTGSV